MSTPTASNSSTAANGGIPATTVGVRTAGGTVPAAAVAPPAAPIAHPQPNQPRGGASRGRSRNHRSNTNRPHPQIPQVTLVRPRNYEGLNLNVHLRNQSYPLLVLVMSFGGMRQLTGLHTQL